MCHISENVVLTATHTLILQIQVEMCHLQDRQFTNLSNCECLSCNIVRYRN